MVKWSQAVDFAAEDPDYAGETRLAAGFGVIYEDVPTDRYQGFLSGKGIFFDIMRGWRIKASPKSAPVASSAVDASGPRREHAAASRKADAK